MDSQLQHNPGSHYEVQDPLTTAGHHSGHDYSEEHHGEKKSVIKKIREKAKKLKNTIKKHGHGQDGTDHHDNNDEDEDDDEQEMEEEPEVHGSPMYDSTRAGKLGGPDAISAQPRGNLERPSVMPEDHYSAPPQPLGQEVNQEQWKDKIPTRTDPPNGTKYPVGNRGSGQDVNRQEGLRGIIGQSTGMVEDPHSPKLVGSVPPNYEAKVTDPTHKGGNEAQVSQIQHSFGKMGIGEEHDSGLGFEPKTLDHNHPEDLPRDTFTRNPSSRSSSNAGKISSSASPTVDKAAVAKDVMASKLRETPSTEPHGTGQSSGGATDYAQKITDTVAGTLTPVYEKVVDAGSAVMSEVQGSVSGTGQLQVQRGSGSTLEADKGVSVKEYLVETLKPGEEDKALSDVVTHAFNRGSHGQTEKKSGEDRPTESVTESVQVRERLGTDGREQHSANVSADKGVTERLVDAMGSWFGVKGNAPEGSIGTSYATDEGLSSNPAGDQKSRSGIER